MKHLCAICTSILSRPCLTPCGHHFCEGCITRALATARRCPIDRRELPNYTPFHDAALERKIQAKILRCPLRRIKGSLLCTWQGEYSTVGKHMEECPLNTYACNDGCRAVLNRTIKNHAESCPARKVACEKCKKEMFLASRGLHERICPKAPVRCESSNCTKLILREERDVHIDNCIHCGLACPFAENGCLAVLSRADMRKHLENVKEHMELLKEENARLKREMNRSDMSTFLQLRKKIKYLTLPEYGTTNNKSKLSLIDMEGHPISLLIERTSSSIDVVMVLEDKEGDGITISFKYFLLNESYQPLCESAIFTVHLTPTQPRNGVKINVPIPDSLVFGIFVNEANRIRKHS
uniref:RING-type domain-containing protein n=1 Tax=Arcella intermedia TaxID=1963864 RepID=A0A6B2L8G4_9EUKA